MGNLGLRRKVKKSFICGSTVSIFFENYQYDIEQWVGKSYVWLCEKRGCKVLNFFLVGLQISRSAAQAFQPHLWIFKFQSYSNFIKSLILSETTWHFQNKTIFWIVFVWSSNLYFRSPNYTHFIARYVKAFWLFKFHLYCLLAFFIWNDSLILRQNIFQNSFYLVCKLHTFCYPFLHILFGT